MYLLTSGELSLILCCKVGFLRAVFPDTPLMSSAVWLVISRMLPWRFRFSGDDLEPLFLTGLWPTSDQPCLHTASGSPAALQHCPTIFSLLSSPGFFPSQGFACLLSLHHSRAWDRDTRGNPVMFIYPKHRVRGTPCHSQTKGAHSDFSLSLNK